MKLDKAALVEKLADVFHEAWMHWSKAVAPDIKDEARLARWEKFWVPYEQLDEPTKDQDREWALEAWKALEPFLGETESPKEEVVEEVKEEVSASLYPTLTKVRSNALTYPALAKILSNTKPKEALESPWIIQDWAGNLMDFGRFKTFDDAEEFLSEKLGDSYEEERGEYDILKDTKG